MKNRIIATCDISLKESLTKNEACAYLGVSPDFIDELRTTGKIDYYKHTQRRRTYSRKSIDNYLRTVLQR